MVAERIDMLLNNDATLLSNTERQQDDSNLSTLTAFIHSFTQLSYSAKDEYKRLVAQRKADAEVAEAKRIRDADKNAQALAGKQKDQNPEFHHG